MGWDKGKYYSRSKKVNGRVVREYVGGGRVGLAGELMARGPRTVADLARVIGITPQGAALAIGHLRDLGWVTESQAKGRGRAILLEITDKGRDGYLKAAGVVEQVDKAMTSGLTPAERDAALAALKVVTDTAGPR